MNSLLDVDQLRTFLAIVETGSFTRAAEIVHKTQSAVSMQMKRLEERLERPIFARDGRASKLTEDGERLLWVSSNRHTTHREEPLPLALGRPACKWRQAAIECLERMGRPYRVLYSSWNAGAVAAAVLAGLAVSVFPESGLRPGMRVLGASDGFPELPSCRIGLLRNPHQQSALTDALSGHIIS